MKFEFKYFNNLDRSYFHTDLHIHSIWSDGKSTISEIAEQAKSLSLTHIAVTDHIRSTSTYFTEYYKEIIRIREEYGMNILVGYEAKVNSFQGDIDVTENVKNKAEVRITSVHRFPIGRKLMSPKVFDKKVCQEVELELSMAVLQNKNTEFDILGHPGGMSLRFHGNFPIIYFEEIIAECTKRGIAFDLNRSYHSSVIKKLKPLFRKYNPLISIGSDAHLSKYVGSSIEIFDSEFNS